MMERHYIILSVLEIDKVDFSKVMQDSIDTVRKSINGSKIFVKWEGETVPEFVETLVTKEGPYTNEQIREILATEEWSKRIPQIPIDYTSYDEEGQIES